MSIDHTQAHYANAPAHERAAAHLAVNIPTLRNKVGDHVLDDGEINWEGVRWASRAWSDGERDLAWLAASFADETPLNMRANIGRLLGPGFSDETVGVIVEAVRIACTGRAGS